MIEKSLDNQEYKARVEAEAQALEALNEAKEAEASAQKLFHELVSAMKAFEEAVAQARKARDEADALAKQEGNDLQNPHSSAIIGLWKRFVNKLSSQ